MANDDALGPRKTMFVLVIVVGCFAVLWPRILSPLILGSTQQQLKPNKFDRDAGCCEVLFESEIAVLEILNAVCSSDQTDGKLSPYAAAECRKTVNETCGVDIAAFLKKHDNVGKTTKMLLDTMRASNSSCLKEHFGVPVLSLTTHQAISWIHEDSIKQERPLMRGAGPHPALRERGRAIPPGVPPPTPRPATLPPHVRVRSSPLSGYFELDIKVSLVMWSGVMLSQPPPIPGMRPPLGSPGGPVPAPKSSMGFVMPIYTICIIVFFVYTLSKILFKRVGTVPYDQISPDPQFRRRVFRDDSRSSPDKLGPKERDTIVTAISGLVAEVQQQMEASYAQNQQRQDVQGNGGPYTNGTILHSGPVQIVASEYQEPFIEKIEPEKPVQEKETKEPALELKEPIPEPVPEPKETTPEEEEEEEEEELEKNSPEKEIEVDPTDELIKLSDKLKEKTDLVAKLTGDFLDEEREKLRLSAPVEEHKEIQSTPDLLEEALKEDSVEDEEEEEEEEEEDEEEEEEVQPEKSSVKVIGMETTAHAADGGAWPRAERPPVTPLPPHRPLHEADTVKSIFLETEIPQQSKVLVTDFVENRADKKSDTKHSPLVVSGKMTLSLIQDAPRDTPERDLESTVDDFTTASAVTQPAAEKEDNLSDEELDEEIEIEEIEEEIEEEEEEEPQKKTAEKKSK